MSYTLLFPGQGSQYVGMAKSFFDIDRAIFDEADEALGFSLSQKMLNGPSDELSLTANTQPAILVHSMAAYNQFKQRFDDKISASLGHSLGEYSALVAAQVLEFSDAVKIVHQRGLFMQNAVAPGTGAMAAVLALAPDKIQEVLAPFGDENSADYTACANFNGDGQTVIAGSKSGVEKASESLKSAGAKRIIPLDVSAPFHCALMKPVQKKMTEVLDSVNFKDARFPIISNVNAQAETSGHAIKKLLIEQIVSPVRFTDCIMTLKSRSLLNDCVVELGPKAALSGIVKKIDRSINVWNIDSVEDFSKLANQ